MRLKRLLKSRYNTLKSKWAVETPIEVKNNIFSAYGCEAHNCGYTNFKIVVDLESDLLYVGIREEQVVKIYSDDGSNISEIEEWAISE